MRILVVDPTYPDSGDEDAHFAENLAKDLSRLKIEFIIHEVDAGPGFSFPAVFIDVLAIVGGALTIFSGPKIVSKNLPKWQAIFRRFSGFLKRRNLQFSIDPTSACASAAFYVLNKSSGGYESITIESCIKQAVSINGMFHSGEVFLDRKITFAQNESELHQEAVTQYNSRYIIGVKIDDKYYTAVIEDDGRCSFLKELV